MALAISGVLLLLGVAGMWGISLFDGYSTARLITVFVTGLSMLSGTVFLVLASFMLFLARERVYYCYGCGRVYPRA